MNYLAVDTSSKHLTVIAKNGDDTVVKHVANCQSQQSRLVMDAVEDALHEACLLLSDCDFFAAAIGPGSFTGIRIGISVVKGFAYALQKPTVGVTSFDCLAYNGVGKLICAIDANHNNFYVAGYNEDKTLFLPPCFIKKDELIALSEQYPVYSFENLPLATVQADIIRGLQTATERKAQSGEFADSLEALYVRKSNAEENRR